MWPYYILILVILVLQKNEKTSKKNKYKYNIAFIIIFLFAALRGNGSGDYFNYLRFSKQIDSLEMVINPNFPVEIGFRTIAFIINEIGLISQWVIIIMNIISIGCIYYLIKKYSPDKMLSILLFIPLYFQFDMHASRTAVAIGLGTLGFKFLYEKKYIQYVLIIILASCFHKTALILLLMPFINEIKASNYTGIILVISSALITVLIPLSEIILNLNIFLGSEYIQRKFLAYLNSPNFGYPYKIYDPRLLLVVGVYIFSAFKLNRNNKVENALRKYLWMNAILMIVLRESTVFVVRLTSYFNIYTIIIIPYIISKYHKPINKTILKLAFIIFYIPYIIGVLQGYVEYKLFFI